MSSAGQGIGMVVGGAVGFFAGGNVALGASIGGAIGGYIDPPKGQNTVGPRLEDRTVQTSSYGADIPTIDGTVALYGNVFWLEGDQLKEHKNTKKVGGKGGPTAKQTTFSYSATFAVGFARRTSKPITGIRRLWLGNELVYDAGSTNLQSILASNLQAGILFKVYDGSDDQQPDPRMQADKGVANVSGYPGLFYIVFYDLDLTAKFNNTLLSTQAKVEVVSDGVGYSESAKVFDAPSLGIDYIAVSSAISQSGIDYAVCRVRNSLDGHFFGYDIWRARFGEFTRRLSVIDHEINVPYGRTPVYPLFISHCVDNRLRVVAWQGQYLSYTGRFTLFDGAVNETEWFDAAAIEYGQMSVAACDENQTFIASSLSACRLYRLEGTSIAAQSSISIKVRGLYLSENRLFALHSSGSTSSTTVSVFSRSDLSLIASYTQSVNGLGGVIDPVSDTVFFLMTGAAVSLWENGVASDLGAVGHAPSGSYQYRWGKVYSDPAYYVQFDPETGGNWAMSGYISQSRLLQNVAKLHDIVIAQCARVGLSSADLDLTELVNSDVRGILAASTGSPRNVLEQLQAAFPFDVIPSGYKLKFKSRGGAAVLTVQEADLGAHIGGEAAVRFSTSVEMATQIPARVAIKFMNADREYDPDEQDSSFTAQDVDRTYSVSLPMVMSPTEAKRTADVLLRKEWAERTAVAPFTLPPTDDYRKLEPADVVDVIAQGRTHMVRLTRIHHLPDGRIEGEGKLTAGAAYTSTAEAQNPLVIGQSLVPLAGSSELILLDIPRIVSDQDVPGLVLGMYGYTANWPGGVAFRSDDSGESYNAITAFDKKTEVFTVAGVPASVPPGSIDFTTRLTLTPTWSGADVFSITWTQLFSYGNLAAYGAPGRWEIVAIKTATASGNDFIVCDLLRGLYGSEWAMPLHVAGDQLVLLDLDAVDFSGMPLAAINTPRSWRGVTAGAAVDSVSDSITTYSAVNLKPLAPVNVRGSRTALDWSWKLAWSPRSRWPVPLFSGSPVPVGESAALYDVEIWNSDYTLLKRTFSGISAAEVEYTEVQQVADFGGRQSTIYGKVYQVSSVVGRGFAALFSLSLSVSADPYASGVVLGMHMEGANNSTVFTDVAGHTVTTVGDAKITTTTPLFSFGASCGIFDGTVDRLEFPGAGVMDFGNDKFTIGGWVILTSTGVLQMLLDSRGTTNDYANAMILCVTPGNNLRFSASSSGAGGNGTWAVNIIGSTALTAGVEYYLEASRDDGNVWRISVNGVIDGTQTVNTSVGAPASTCYFGHGCNGSGSLGYPLISRAKDWLITKGFCRHSTNFTPSGPFSDP